MTTQFNTYRNIYTPKVKDYTTIQEWFNLIQTSEYSGVILQARNFGNTHNMYDSLKATLPAITYNFTFKDNKENVNITGTTGLLYIDVDDLTFDINSLEKSKIFAYYKSFGGNGYALLVQVDGMTSENYEATYAAICNELGLKNFQDKNAKKMTQFNVLSFDPDIFINYDSFVFTSTENVLSSDVTKKDETYTSHLSTYSLTDKVIRFNNLYEQIEFDDYDCVHNFKEGWQYVSCWIPFKKIKEGNRNSSLLSYCNNLVWLNPHLTSGGAETIMTRVNLQMCDVPVDKNQIKSVVRGIYKAKEAGTLQPIVNRKKRKIVFAPHSLLTPEQKFAKSRELLAEYRTSESKQKLNNLIEEWDFTSNGKITIRQVVKVGKMGINTVQKYWSEFKEHVAELNKNMGHVQPAHVAIAQLTSINDTLLSDEVKVLPVALNEDADIAYNFNDAGFNMVGITLLMNAVIGLPDDELVKLVTGIEDMYHDKPVGEVIINAGGVTYSFINDVTASLVQFNGYN